MDPKPLKWLKKVKAPNPQRLTARLDLGSALLGQGQWVAAEREFRALLAEDPRRMGVQLYLVECLLGQATLDQASQMLEALARPGALQGQYANLRPHLAELWARLSLALLEARRFQDAEAACITALRIDLTNFRAMANLGSVWMAQNSLEKATRQFRELCAAHPADERARLLLITGLARSGDRPGTCREIAQILQQAPTSFLVHKSVMGPLYSLGCWDDYRAEIERYRRVAPGLPYLDYEQSFVDLLFGDLRQGWEHFEARLLVPEDLRPLRVFEEPAWQGEPFEGRTLLLWAEQGIGDTLMFLRYLPMVKALGGRVLLEAQGPVLNVAGTCPGLDGLVPAGASSQDFDLQASILSLPWIFHTELESIPDSVPYLRVPAEVPHRQGLQELLAAAGEHTRIGLVWAGNPAHARDSERSIPALALAPLAALPGVAWFSFQLDQAELPPLPNLVSLAPCLGDFSDTAFALSEMDLLITVDTSVAHLAGALGIPILLLITHQPDYRWLLEREDSPWYPTLRLYRQPRFGDWAAVLQQIVADLSQT